MFRTSEFTHPFHYDFSDGRFCRLIQSNKDIHENISHFLLEIMYEIKFIRRMLLSFIRKKQKAPYNDCFLKNIKKNHNDDGVIVWYNVGQSGGNKG